jgi:hypothetical protein
VNSRGAKQLPSVGNGGIFHIGQKVVYTFSKKEKSQAKTQSFSSNFHAESI